LSPTPASLAVSVVYSPSVVLNLPLDTAVNVGSSSKLRCVEKLVMPARIPI
jgi:hypothetical protein